MTTTTTMKLTIRNLRMTKRMVKSHSWEEAWLKFTLLEHGNMNQKTVLQLLLDLLTLQQVVEPPT
jgi:hypothetical protein